MRYTEAIAEIDKLLKQYGETAPEWLRVAREAIEDMRYLRGVLVRRPTRTTGDD